MVKEDNAAAEALEEELQVTEELREALRRERLKNAGRPKDNRPAQEQGCKEGEARTTYILPKELAAKMKLISLFETKTIKALVRELFEEFGEKWESEHGTISINSQTTLKHDRDQRH